MKFSLNARDFFGVKDCDRKLQDVGVVNGDIIYIESLDVLDDIKTTLENEVGIISEK